MNPELKSNKHFLTALKWAKILATLYFISLGLEFFQLVFGGISHSKSVLGIAVKFFFTSIFTLITAINLYNFSKYGKTSIDKFDSKFLYQSFRHLRIFFTVLGISIILLSTLFIIGFIIFIISKFIV